MKKEAILATIFGILFGAIVGAVVLYQSQKNNTTMVSQEQQKPTVSTQSAKLAVSQKQLLITEPAKGAIIKTNSVKIKGQVPQNSLVIAQNSATEVVKKFETENFSLDFPLQLGENNIQISVYSVTSTPQEEMLKVFYIPE